MSTNRESPFNAHALLQDHGTTFAEQAGITLRDRPSPLFRLLVLTALLSANIDARLGLRTSRALTQAGYTTARHLADALRDLPTDAKGLARAVGTTDLFRLGAALVSAEHSR